MRVLLERHQRFEVRDRIQHPSAVNCRTQHRRGEPRATAGGLPRGSGKACAPGCMKALRLRAASASSHTTITLQARLGESAKMARIPIDWGHLLSARVRVAHKPSVAQLDQLPEFSLCRRLEIAVKIHRHPVEGAFSAALFRLPAFPRRPDRLNIALKLERSLRYPPPARGSRPMLPRAPKLALAQLWSGCVVCVSPTRRPSPWTRSNHP